MTAGGATHVVVVVPTYNERASIEGVLAGLLALEPSGELPAGWRLSVLVVDGASPDGTAAAVGAWEERGPVELLVRPKAGLGAAYVAGMAHALEAMGADVVCEMDGDGSHLPAELPRLLAALAAGPARPPADFVIGSRYVAGGSIPRTWVWYRRLTSLLGNLAARFVAGLVQVRDCTSGFRAIRARVLRPMDLGGFKVQGYAFQVALLHAAVAAGAVVREVPITFVERQAGRSKLGLRDLLEFALNVWWIRLRSHRIFLRFAAVGISGVGINLGLFSLLMAAGLDPVIASPVAIEASILSNFLLNNAWTFRERRPAGSFHAKGLKFNLVSLLALAASYGTFLALHLAWPGGDPRLHQLAGIVPAMGINYFLNSYWTFRPGPAAGSAGRGR